MRRIKATLIVAILAVFPVLAISAGADTTPSAAYRGGAAGVPEPEREMGAVPGSDDGRSDEPTYLLRRGTEVAMLWSILTKKPFSAEGIACDYLVERNFERERPLMYDSEYSCGSMDEFTRHDQIAAVVPHIKSEYAALATKVNEFRVMLTVPMNEYDFKRGGYTTGLSDGAEVSFSFSFQDPLEDAYLLLENGGRLAFVELDVARARALEGPFWLFELTLRPTGFTEKPFTRASTLKYIKARIVRARLFTTEDGRLGSLLSLRPAARAPSDSPVFEVAFDSGAAPHRSVRRPALK